MTFPNERYSSVTGDIIVIIDRLFVQKRHGEFGQIAEIL